MYEISSSELWTCGKAGWYDGKQNNLINVEVEHGQF